MVPQPRAKYERAQVRQDLVGYAYNLEQLGAELLAADLTTDDRQAQSIQALIQAFQPTAKTVVVELDYFDIDYRSEFSSSHETSFVVRDPSTRRLHFFERAISKSQTSLLKLVQVLQKSYCGYAVLRPQFPGTVGRSLVSPLGRSAYPWDDETRDVTLIDKVDLARRIRTAVPEVVELFGVPLHAVGVPYMEQDGHLLRCAHVSAWICHYTAVLRGRVPRRVTAAFHFAEDETGSYGRQYPSSGLTVHVLSRMLRALDLPPEVIDMAGLVADARVGPDDQEQTPKWLHRSDFCKLLNSPAKQNYELFRARTTNSFTSAVCRYLNSGIPVILADNKEEHTTVICGYIRKPAKLQDGSSSADDKLGGGVEAFITQDDGERPYTLISAESIIDRVLIDGDQDHLRNNMALVVPLPRGLWLSGSVAEQHGAEVLQTQIRQRSKQLNLWLDAHTAIRAQTREMYRSTYEYLVQGLADEADCFSVRSYVSSGSELKVSMSERVRDQTVSEVLGYTRLPRFVWVVELIQRDLRTLDDESDCVLATVAFDASVVSDAPMVDSLGDPIFMHLPGQVFQRGHKDARLISRREDSWRVTKLGLYRTGRWRHDAPWSNDGNMYYLAYKGAQARV